MALSTTGPARVSTLQLAALFQAEPLALVPSAQSGQRCGTEHEGHCAHCQSGTSLDAMKNVAICGREKNVM